MEQLRFRARRTLVLVIQWGYGWAVQLQTLPSPQPYHICSPSCPYREMWLAFLSSECRISFHLCSQMFGVVTGMVHCSMETGMRQIVLVLHWLKDAFRWFGWSNCSSLFPHLRNRVGESHCEGETRTVYPAQCLCHMYPRDASCSCCLLLSRRLLSTCCLPDNMLGAGAW